MNILSILTLAITLMACGDASRLTEPNTYRKCSEYSVRAEHVVAFDMSLIETITDTTYIMTHNGKSVALTNAQAERLDTDPTGVCREVMSRKKGC